MPPDDTGSRRPHTYAPWLSLLAGVGVASLFGWSLAGVCAWRSNSACTVGFTVGPLAPVAPQAALPQGPADVASPSAAPIGTSRDAAESPSGSQAARAPETKSPVSPVGNLETANPNYVALVIGNANYQTQAPLKNPHNDAGAIAKRLSELNYTLVGGGPHLDLSRAQFAALLDEFRALARNAKVAFVYYAGHGIQVDNKEPIFLIPIDAKLQRERDLGAEAIRLSDLQDLLPDGNEQIGVLVLDACRTSNFPLEGSDGQRRSTGQRGLIAARAKKNSFIAFSASRGEPANDQGRNGVNSPYVEALLLAMEPRKWQLPDIKEVFSRVDEEFKRNGQLQTPEKDDKLGTRTISLAAPQKPRPLGWTGRDCPQCPEIKVLKPGIFTIGAPVSEAGSFDDERPQKEIEFTKPFAIGLTEVTFDEFDACAAEKACETQPADEGWGRGQRPVINVTWNDAQQYAAWLSVKTGNRYRLPSEAEWEYAARAGTKTAYPWGPTARRDKANYGGAWPEGTSRPEDGANPKVEGQDRWLYTAPVRSFPANWWGLFDMHGNVWEWVEDCYPRRGNLGGRPYSDMPRSGSPFLQKSCPGQVNGKRGGSWDSEPALIRSAVRDGDATDRSWVGFRIARDN